MGSANRFVANAWTDSASTVAQHQDGIVWAQQQLVQPTVVASGLCSIKTATSLATNRWTYAIELWSPTASGGIAVPSDARFDYTNARNLREEFNTSTLVDGMDITSPTSTIGPVGSIYTAGAWTTSNLKARVYVWVVYDSAGTAVPFFDRPNPIRCS
jgi:hypothetical protein